MHSAIIRAALASLVCLAAFPLALAALVTHGGFAALALFIVMQGLASIILPSID
jgi:hypothetical protein